MVKKGMCIGAHLGPVVTTFSEFLKLITTFRQDRGLTTWKKMHAYIIKNKYDFMKVQLKTVRIIIDSQEFFEKHWQYYVVLSTLGNNMNQAHRWCYDNFGPRIDPKDPNQRWQFLSFENYGWGRRECAFFFKTETDKIEFALRFAQ